MKSHFPLLQIDLYFNVYSVKEDMPHEYCGEGNAEDDYQSEFEKEMGGFLDKVEKIKIWIHFSFDE